MTHAARAPFPASPWDRIIATIAGAAAAVVVVLAILVAVPPSVGNITATVSDGSTPVPVGDGGIVVPSGWVFSDHQGGLIIRTPDGGLAAQVDAVDRDARSALEDSLAADLGTVPSATVGPLRTETLASGLRVVHADVGEDSVYAAVAIGDASTVRIVAHAADDHDLVDYRAALGVLLDGVRP